MCISDSLKALNLTLNGQGAKGPFMSNPTSCRPAVTTVDIVSYESPDPVSRSAEFTPTACEKLAFAPKVDISASGTTGRAGRPALKVAVTQAVGEAAGKRVQLTLPDAVNSELLHTDRKSCSLVQQAAAACPPESLIGSATAETAVLPFPPTGPVHLPTPFVARQSCGCPAASTAPGPEDPARPWSRERFVAELGEVFDLERLGSGAHLAAVPRMAEVIAEICDLVEGPVSAEAVAADTQTMVMEGRRLAQIATNVVVKLPLTRNGLMATRELSHDGIQVNVTLCFSAAQGLLAAK